MHFLNNMFNLINLANQEYMLDGYGGFWGGNHSLGLHGPTKIW